MSDLVDIFHQKIIQHSTFPPPTSHVFFTFGLALFFKKKQENKFQSFPLPMLPSFNHSVNQRHPEKIKISTYT